MSKTLVRLAKEYVIADQKRVEKIISTKTVIKNIDQFNWLCDMLLGYDYELEESNEHYSKWIKVKKYYDENIKCVN